jgi:hypothetical protein
MPRIPDNILVSARMRLATNMDDTMPPRDPSDDDDEEDEHEEQESDEEPPVVREPEPDE